jgi:formate dehydrogenase assembly factor FdhD
MDRELAAGVLYSDGVISSPEEIKKITVNETGAELEITGLPLSEVKGFILQQGACLRRIC